MFIPELHLPGYNYCGPGTKDFSKEPINALDAACREHDLSYRDNWDYIYYNQGDENLINAASKISGQEAFLVRSIFQAKKKLAPWRQGMQPSLANRKRGRKESGYDFNNYKKHRHTAGPYRKVRLTTSFGVSGSGRAQYINNTGDISLLPKRKTLRKKTFRKKWYTKRTRRGRRTVAARRRL